MGHMGHENQVKDALYAKWFRVPYKISMVVIAPIEQLFSKWLQAIYFIINCLKPKYGKIQYYMKWKQQKDPV